MISIYPHLTDRATLELSDLFKVTQVLTLRIKIQILTTTSKAQYYFPLSCCPSTPSPIPHFLCISHTSLPIILQYVVFSSATGLFFEQAIYSGYNISFLFCLLKTPYSFSSISSTLIYWGSLWKFEIRPLHFLTSSPLREVYMPAHGSEQFCGRLDQEQGGSVAV